MCVERENVSAEQNRDAPRNVQTGGEPPGLQGPMRAPLTRHRVWSSEELFGEETEVLIAHGEQTYRLRRTRNGKLILCK